MFRRFYPVALALLMSYSCSSQQYQFDSSNNDPAVQNAINLYHNYLAPENGFYNGSEYAYKRYYPFRFSEGHPFLFTQLFTEGTVFYDGMVYHAPLLLDIIKGELLTRSPSNIYCKLNSERIEWFKLQNYTFIHLRPDSTDRLADGFYALLSKGQVSLYKAFRKNLKDDANSVTVVDEIAVEQDYYFIIRENKYFRIKNKKTLLEALADKKKVMQRFMRTNSIKIKRNSEQAFTRVVIYYNSINAKR